MNLIKCPNGHFYDASKFQFCPHCSSINPASNDLTVPLTGGINGHQEDVMTVPATGAVAQMNVSFPQNVSATPSFNPVPSQGIEDMKTVPIANGAQQVAPPPALAQAAPIPFPAPVVPAPPVPPVPPVDPAKTAPIMDDQKTVGLSSITVTGPAGTKRSVEPVVGWVVVINGPERGRSMQLKSGRNFVGRAPGNDILLKEDTTVSREKHAIIVFEPRTQTFLVQPGTSKELFYVNDEVVLDTKKIEAYDTLSIGRTKLVFIPFCGEFFSWDDSSKKS